MAAKLPAYLREIQKVYAAIGDKIENLIFLLNETETSRDADAQELAKKIEKGDVEAKKKIASFLTSLEKNVAQEKSLAQGLSREKKKPFLDLLRIELRTIRELSAYIILSRKKPTPAVITKINELHRAVTKEINQQEALAA